MHTLEELIQAEILKSRLTGESLFFEMTCQSNSVHYECKQRFKFLRGTGGIIYCPKCGYQQNINGDPELRRAISAFPVD